MSVPDIWRCSESRPIPPFRISSHALSDTTFRCRDDEDYTSDEPYCRTLELKELQDVSFRPSFRFKIDLSVLSRETGLPANALTASLVLKDPALLTTRVVDKWAVNHLPDQYDVPEPLIRSTAATRGLELAVLVSPRKRLTAEFRTAHHPGQVVASRHYALNVPDDGVGFPITTVDSKVFKDLGLPPETIWVLDWRSTIDFDKPVEEVLRVLLNFNHTEKLLRLPANDPAAAVVWTNLAAEAFLEIATVVLSSEPAAPVNSNGLLGRLLKRLTAQTGLPQDALIARAKTGEEGLRFFRAHLQSSFSLHNRLTAMVPQGRVR